MMYGVGDVDLQLGISFSCQKVQDICRFCEIQVANFGDDRIKFESKRHARLPLIFLEARLSEINCR